MNIRDTYFNFKELSKNLLQKVLYYRKNKTFDLRKNPRNESGTVFQGTQPIQTSVLGSCPQKKISQ